MRRGIPALVVMAAVAREDCSRPAVAWLLLRLSAASLSKAGVHRGLEGVLKERPRRTMSEARSVKRANRLAEAGRLTSDGTRVETAQRGGSCAPGPTL